jgi:hypothetical protein
VGRLIFLVGGWGGGESKDLPVPGHSGKVKVEEDVAMEGGHDDLVEGPGRAAEVLDDMDNAQKQEQSDRTEQDDFAGAEPDAEGEEDADGEAEVQADAEGEIDADGEADDADGDGEEGVVGLSGRSAR